MTAATDTAATMRLTHLRELAHVLSAPTAETSGTWTGLACPAHGLTVGSDVDPAVLRRLVIAARGAGHGCYDFIWTASPDFAAVHGSAFVRALEAYEAGQGEDTSAFEALWSVAWAGNWNALEAVQGSGIRSVASRDPHRFLIASYEHHTGPHSLAAPHVHNIVIPDAGI